MPYNMQCHLQGLCRSRHAGMGVQHRCLAAIHRNLPAVCAHPRAAVYDAVECGNHVWAQGGASVLSARIRGPTNLLRRAVRLHCCGHPTASFCCYNYHAGGWASRRRTAGMTTTMTTTAPSTMTCDSRMGASRRSLSYPQFCQQSQNWLWVVRTPKRLAAWSPRDPAAPGGIRKTQSDVAATGRRQARGAGGVAQALVVAIQAIRVFVWYAQCLVHALPRRPQPR